MEEVRHRRPHLCDPICMKQPEEANPETEVDSWLRGTGSGTRKQL